MILWILYIVVALSVKQLCTTFCVATTSVPLVWFLGHENGHGQRATHGNNFNWHEKSIWYFRSRFFTKKVEYVGFKNQQLNGWNPIFQIEDFCVNWRIFLGGRFTNIWSSTMFYSRTTSFLIYINNLPQSLSKTTSACMPWYIHILSS